MDEQQPGVFLTEDRFSEAGTCTYWAEDSDGSFSNQVTVVWASKGRLALPQNICINGTPIASWTTGFTVDVPYTVTWDEVTHATEYRLCIESHANNTNNNVVLAYDALPDPSGQVSVTVLFREKQSALEMRVESMGIGYDMSYTSDPNLGDAVCTTAAPLVMNTSDNPGTVGHDITFTCMSSATSAWLCAEREGNVTVLPMTLQSGVFTVDASSSELGYVTYWVADSNGAVSQKKQLGWIPAPHPYPSGTPTLTITASDKRLPTWNMIWFRCPSAASSLTFWTKTNRGTEGFPGWWDNDTGEYTMAFNPGIGGDYTVWAEDEDKNFSNQVTITYESVGALDVPGNVCINGVPLAQWASDFVIGVPYTIISDTVANATDYCYDFYGDNETSGCTSDTPEGTVVLRELSKTLDFVVQAYGIGYDMNGERTTLSSKVVLGTAAPLTLNASATSADANKTVTFTAVSNANTATLCYRRENDSRVKTIPMTRNNVAFTAEVSYPQDDYGNRYYWVADSDNAISPEVTVEWIRGGSGSHQYPTGTPTLTLNIDKTNPLSNQVINLSCQSGAQALSFYCSDGSWCCDMGGWQEDQPDVFVNFDRRSSATTHTYWTEDSDGCFSNQVTVTWTSIGALDSTANTCINGIPVAQWGLISPSACPTTSLGTRCPTPRNTGLASSRRWVAPSWSSIR